MFRIATLCLLAGLGSLAAQQLSAEKARIATLERRLVAPCCWSETVAFHRSEIALEMRREIAALVAQGRTDREILDRYKAQYGPRILIEPEGAAALSANTVPWVAAACGLAIVFLLIRRLRKPVPAPAAAPDLPVPPLPDDD